MHKSMGLKVDSFCLSGSFLELSDTLTITVCFDLLHAMVSHFRFKHHQFSEDHSEVWNVSPNVNLHLDKPQVNWLFS